MFMMQKHMTFSSMPLYVHKTTCFGLLSNSELLTELALICILYIMPISVSPHVGEDPLSDSECDLDSVAGVLKLYFRGLEPPLFPYESYLELLECVRKSPLDPVLFVCRYRSSCCCYFLYLILLLLFSSRNFSHLNSTSLSDIYWYRSRSQLCRQISNLALWEQLLAAHYHKWRWSKSYKY